MTCPWCSVWLPTITARTSSRARRTAQLVIRSHSRPHATGTRISDESPEDLGAGIWMLDPVRRVRVWQPAE